MRRRQLHRHDSRNISCRDTVDLRLLDEASTAPLARSPACLEQELFGVLNKMLFVCGSEASSEVWSRLGLHTFGSRAMSQNKKKSVLWYLWGAFRARWVSGCMWSRPQAGSVVSQTYQQIQAHSPLVNLGSISATKRRCSRHGGA